MGGNAFNSTLASNAFPRLPPGVYHALKSRLLPEMKKFYAWVSIPTEAPEKRDYGDLDFLVAGPLNAVPSSNEGVPDCEEAPYIPHQLIQDAIGAKFVNPMDGNRTSNYAIPVKLGEWATIGNVQEEEQGRSVAENGEIFYQVDVHVCFDKMEFNRSEFFQSYGDMGMILGLVARNIGLHLGVNGLTLPDRPNPPFELSNSFDDILRFLNLSKDIYEAGFSSKSEIFEWVSSMKYFDPRQFKSEGLGIRKVKPERKMYAEFVEWVTERSISSGSRVEMIAERENVHSRVKEDALVHFKKKAAFEAFIYARENRQKLKEAFSGHRIREWAELGEYWKGVKMVMDGVREHLGGNDGVLKYLEENGEGELKRVVLCVRDELGLLPITQGLAQVTEDSVAVSFAKLTVKE